MLRKVVVACLLAALAAANAEALPETVAVPQPPRAAAQSSATQTISEMAAWIGQFNDINARLAAATQTLPIIPTETKDDAEIHTFVADARSWSANMLLLTAQLRRDLAAIGPAPRDTPAAVIELTDRLRHDLPGDLDIQDEFARRYSGMADAIERGDPDAAGELQLASVDSAALTLRRSRDGMRGQAALLPPESPQVNLLRAYAYSYDGGLAQMAFARAYASEQDINGAALAQDIATAASNMRREIAQGRVAVEALRAQFRGSMPRAEVALAARLSRAMDTYAGSFDRELSIAAELDAMSALIASGRDAEAISDEWEAHFDRFSVLDFERVADGQRRVAILQGE